MCVMASGTVTQTAPTPTVMPEPTGSLRPKARRDGVPLVRLHRIGPSTGQITAEVPLGEDPPGSDRRRGRPLSRPLPLSEGSVWTLVEYESLVLRIDPGDLVVSESLEGIASGSSDGRTARPT